MIELKGSPGSPSVGAAVAQLFAKDPTLLEARDGCNLAKANLDSRLLPSFRKLNIHILYIYNHIYIFVVDVSYDFI